MVSCLEARQSTAVTSLCSAEAVLAWASQFGSEIEYQKLGIGNRMVSESRIKNVEARLKNQEKKLAESDK